MHILIVEDEPAMRRSFERLLHSANHTTCWSESVAGAAQLLSSETIDLVLLDILLGPNRLTGLDLARLMSDHPLWVRIPIIVTSSLPSLEIRERASSYAFEGLKCVMLEKTMLGEGMKTLLEIIDDMTAPPSAREE